MELLDVASAALASGNETTEKTAARPFFSVRKRTKVTDRYQALRNS
jgi:hypothetical protein